MAPMGIRLSPLGIGVFCLLALGVLYHVYSGFLSSRFSAFLDGLPGPEQTVDLRQLLAAAVKAAELGGKEVTRVRESNLLDEKRKGKTREGADDKMTRGDELSNKKMYHLIKTAFPGIQVNTEETVEEDDEGPAPWDGTIPGSIMDKIQIPRLVPAGSITVWIDPLDATYEYTAWAMVDGGSNVEKRSDYNAKTPTIIVSRTHSGLVKQVTLETFGNQTGIISAGGSGYKVLSLLDVTEEKQEHADVYVHVTLIKKWDICAGNAILNALGGHMTTLKGENIVYTGSSGNEGGLLASIGMDHDALVRKLADKIPAVKKKPPE
uniref:Inositol monophosphatase 3 n=1 Tax=Leptobrachium leishanense TaxID=445787 RepID=A0A8C5MEG4_9ANUR